MTVNSLFKKQINHKQEEAISWSQSGYTHQTGRLHAIKWSGNDLDIKNSPHSELKVKKGEDEATTVHEILILRPVLILYNCIFHQESHVLYLICFASIF